MSNWEIWIDRPPLIDEWVVALETITTCRYVVHFHDGSKHGLLITETRTTFRDGGTNQHAGYDYDCEPCTCGRGGASLLALGGGHEIRTIGLLDHDRALDFAKRYPPQMARMAAVERVEFVERTEAKS